MNNSDILPFVIEDKNPSLWGPPEKLKTHFFLAGSPFSQEYFIQINGRYILIPQKGNSAFISAKYNIAKEELWHITYALSYILDVPYFFLLLIKKKNQENFLRILNDLPN